MTNYKLKPTKKTIEQLVKASKYDYANSNITQSNFPLESVHPEVEIVKIGKYLTTEEVLAELSKQGFSPATMTDLLHFGIQYPDEQRKYPIVALGSVWARPIGNPNVGYLYGNSDNRRLDLDWFNAQWGADYRFLAVRKSPSDSGELGTESSVTWPLETLEINGIKYRRSDY